MKESEDANNSEPTFEGPAHTGILVHLAGSRRGAMDAVSEEHTLVGTSADAAVHFAADHERAVAARHAELVSDEGGPLLRALGGNAVQVNGEPVEERTLAAGDVIRLGEDGPLLRYRVYSGEPSPYKTLAQALADCAANARYCADNPMSRVGTFAGAMPGEVASLRPAMRWGMGLAAALVLAALAGLAYQTYMLEQRLEQRAERLETISAELEETRRESVKAEEIEALRERLSGTLQRLSELDSQLGAAREVVARASQSVVFVQGMYEFVDPDSGKRLRMALDEYGQPIKTSSGQVRIRLGGPGPTLKSSYTGSAFVVDKAGLLLTNRHVAEPWDFDKRSRRLIKKGLEARPQRLIGYLPGREEPFDLELAAISENEDLAVLRAPAIAGEVEALELAEAAPQAGERVVLLGYPAGIKALVARADRALLERLGSKGEMDAFAVTQRLSEANAIAPLATSGIIGQVTSSRIVYDAGTTGGGSGGPLLNRNGSVVAVNQAIMKEFEGSNLGVPADRARALLAEARREQ